MSSFCSGSERQSHSHCLCRVCNVLKGFCSYSCANVVYPRQGFKPQPTANHHIYWPCIASWTVSWLKHNEQNWFLPVFPAPKKVWVYKAQPLSPPIQLETCLNKRSGWQPVDPVFVLVNTQCIAYDSSFDIPRSYIISLFSFFFFFPFLRNLDFLQNYFLVTNYPIQTLSKISAFKFQKSKEQQLHNFTKRIIQECFHAKVLVSKWRKRKTCGKSVGFRLQVHAKNSLFTKPILPMPVMCQYLAQQN